MDTHANKHINTHKNTHRKSCTDSHIRTHKIQWFKYCIDKKLSEIVENYGKLFAKYHVKIFNFQIDIFFAYYLNPLNLTIHVFSSLSNL